MKLSGPHNYTLLIDESRSAYRHCPTTKLKSFVAPATTRSPKLYVISVDGVPIYIGQTVQSISSRLRLGFTADGTTGYYGYAWRHKHEQVTLDVWVLEEASEDEEVFDLEAIEAEFVYLIRHERGQWPAFQTEIHFRPSSELHRELARSIYQHFEHHSTTTQAEQADAGNLASLGA